MTIDGVTVHFFTPRTRPSRFEGPVLVPWANSAMVEDAERLSPNRRTNLSESALI